MITKSNEIVDISNKIHDLIYRNLVQVNHPHKIEPRVLESYISGDNQKDLILTHGEATTKASILNINQNSIVVELLKESFKLGKNNRTLIVFNHPTYNKTFVIQAIVERTDFSKCWLKYLDPRFDNRYKFQLKNDLNFYSVPSIFYNFIKNRQVQIIRQTLIDKEEQEKRITLNDGIYSGVNLNDPNIENLDLDADNLHSDYRSMLEKPPKKASLKDISRGGSCIVLDEEPYESKGLILVNIETPSINFDDPKVVCNPLSLQLLGAIRGISKIDDKYGVHIAFLKRLNTDFSDIIFSALEKYDEHVKEPI